MSKFHFDRSKIDEVRSIWASVAPGRVSIQVYKLRISREKLQNVFLKLVIFEVCVHYNSKSTGPIVLKFCTVLLHIIYQVSLGDFLFIWIIISFTITNKPIVFSEFQFFSFQVLRKIEKSKITLINFFLCRNNALLCKFCKCNWN